MQTFNPPEAVRSALRVPTDPGQDHELRALADSCVRFGKYQPGELLRWLVNDVLADFGISLPEKHPDDARHWIRQSAATYASVAARHPFSDVLGHLYQSIGSRGHRGALGQFFTPAPISALMASMLAQRAPARDEGTLLRACEPACGSGALLLAFMQAHVQLGGRSALRHWSITAIDLDPLCARMCAAQVLSTLYLQRLDLGELVVYRGSALGPPSGLSVVVHTTMADLTPDLVLPALHPSRLLALRDACRSQNLAESGQPQTAPAPQEPGLSKAAARNEADGIDLFADF